MANKRPDGDGLVRKRSDGRWEGRIVVGHKEDGKPIYRSVFAKTQKELMEKLHRSIETFRDVELPPIRFHDLRHTFATHALTSGVDAKTLSGILGHTNASFTLDTYTHMTTEMQKKASGIVGNFLDEIM